MLKSISERINDLEWSKDYPIGWQGTDYPEEWNERSYPPPDDDGFYRRVDQAIARGEPDPLGVAMKEAWKEHDQKANGGTANGSETIQ